MHRVTETSGIGVSLMRVVCAWCKADMGAKVCEPAQVNKVSHGMCGACRESFGVLPIAADAGNEAAAVQATTPPGAEPLQVTGTADSAGVMTPPPVVEHAWARPAASFTFNEGKIA